jgi:hypothetical protein
MQSFNLKMLLSVTAVTTLRNDKGVEEQENPQAASAIFILAP